MFRTLWRGREWGKLSDRELLGVWAAEGQGRAFEEVVRRYVGMVYSTSVRSVGERSRAEDVTQQVFWLLSRKAGEVLARRGEIEEGREVGIAGWLYEAARRVASESNRSERRRVIREHAAAMGRKEEGEMKEASSLWQEIEPEVDAVLESMSAGDREVILMRYMRGMEVEELAGMLGVERNTVSKRVQRAMERLREGLEARGVKVAGVGEKGMSMLGSAMAVGVSGEGVPVGMVERVCGGLGGTKVGGGGAWRKAAVTGGAVAVMGVLVGAVWMGRGMESGQHAGGVAAATMGAEAGLKEEELRRIRVALFKIRHHNLGVQVDEWVGAAKELAEIGKPAVPEVVAELQRTRSDSAMRALAMVLGRIGDVRAVPALIEVSKRAKMDTSTYGLATKDGALAEWIREGKTAEREENSFNYQLAVYQIADALQRMTGRTEYDLMVPYRALGRPEGQAAWARVPADFHDAWSRWWDAEWKRVVSDAALVTLGGEHSAEAIEEAGEAEVGAVFPRGPKYRLGKVVDVWISCSTGMDVKTGIDLDTGRMLSPLEVGRLIPEGLTERERGGRFSARLGGGAGGAGIDLMSMVFQERGVRQDNRVTCSVYAYEDRVWPVENERWESLEEEMASGKRIELGSVGPVTSVQITPEGKNDAKRMPATFLMRTQDGGAAVVQVVESDPQRGEGGAVRVRYRQVEPHPGNITEAKMRELPQVEGKWSEVKELELPVSQFGEVEGFDFDAEKKVEGPVLEGDGGTMTAMDEYGKRTGVDLLGLLIATQRRSEEIEEQGYVMLLNVKMIGLSRKGFETVQAAEVAGELDRAELHSPQPLFWGTNVHGTGTAAIRTAEGRLVFIQLVPPPEGQEKTKVKMRYKVWEPGGKAEERKS